MQTHRIIQIGFAIVLLSSLGGCSLRSNVSSTPRSSTEQRLLVTSIKRALTEINTDRFNGKSVYLELTGLTADQAYAKSYITAELKSSGANVVADSKAADIHLQAFAPSIGVDRDETLFGIPAFAAPAIGVPVPEVALFKWVQNRGYTEFEAYAFDAKSGKFMYKTQPRVGESKYDIFTILLFISFGVSDLDDEQSKTSSEAVNSNNSRN